MSPGDNVGRHTSHIRILTSLKPEDIRGRVGTQRLESGTQLCECWSCGNGVQMWVRLVWLAFLTRKLGSGLYNNHIQVHCSVWQRAVKLLSHPERHMHFLFPLYSPSSTILIDKENQRNDSVKLYANMNTYFYFARDTWNCFLLFWTTCFLDFVHRL
jgi:hypothetical protein